MSEKQNGNGGSWYKTGAEGEAQAEREAEERAKGFVNRLWLPVGASTTIVFLDTEGFYFHEHQIYRNNSWKNWYTCLREFSECPICEADYKPSYVAAYTVIDTAKYVSKKTGKEVKNVKKLLILKSTVQPMWARRREEAGGDLTYGVFKLYRDKKEQASTGEDVQYKGKLTQEKVLMLKPEGMSNEEFLAPYDYLELFKPKSVDELRSIMGQTVIGSEQPSGGNGASNHIPIPPNAATVAGDASIEDLL